MKYKLGKNPAVFDRRTLRFGDYVKPEVEPPPASVDYGARVDRWPMYDNDRYGDCTCAAAGHMIQSWTANAGDIDYTSVYSRGDEWVFPQFPTSVSAMDGAVNVPLDSLCPGRTPEHAMVKKFRAERYHGVGDDLTQPIDFAAVEKFDRFYVDLVRGIANRPDKPEWNSDSYFKPHK